jgi:hypothetical protein
MKPKSSLISLSRGKADGNRNLPCFLCKKEKQMGMADARNLLTKTLGEDACLPYLPVTCAHEIEIEIFIDFSARRRSRWEWADARNLLTKTLGKDLPLLLWICNKKPLLNPAIWAVQISTISTISTISIISIWILF